MDGKPRLQRGHTRDPWPCCRRPANERSGRPKGTICDDCKSLIRIGRETRALQSDRGERVYLWTTMPHWWPMYYGEYSFTTHGVGRRLSDAMFHVVSAVCRRTHGPWDEKNEGRFLECGGPRARYEAPVAVSADPQLRERLDELDAAIRAALADCYAEGESRGRSIILQLAGGEMSLKDFNERATER